MTGENPDATEDTRFTLPADFPQKVAAALATPEVQAIESDVLSGLPKKVRGGIYSIGGGLGAIASGTVSYALVNPGVFPEWAVALASIAAPILIAFTGGTAWASLGKK